MVIVILIMLIGMSAYSKLCSISHAIGLRSRDGWEPVTVLSSSDKLSLSNCREFSISSCVNSVEKSGHLRIGYVPHCLFYGKIHPLSSVLRDCSWDA